MLMCGKNISVPNILFTMRLIMSQEGRTFFVLQPINCTESVHSRFCMTPEGGRRGAYMLMDNSQSPMCVVPS